MPNPVSRGSGRPLPALVALLLLLPTVACGKETTASSAALTLPLKTYGGRPLVAVTINDHGPYDFILDTGAEVTLVDSTLASELGLVVSGTMETGSPIGPPGTFDVTRIERLGVGPLALGERQALLFDFSAFMGSPDAPRGVLSYLAFEGYLIVQDNPGDELRLERGSLSDGAPNIFHLGEADRMAEISMTIAGQAITAHIDTGSPGGIALPLSLAESLPLVSPPVVVGRGKTVNSTFDVYAATLDGVAEVGPFRLERPELTFIDGAPVGNVGNGFLDKYVVTIDPAGRRMRLDEAASGAKGANPARMVRKGGGKKRYGIRFAGIGGERLEVVGVDPGSPGEMGGVKQGDVIVAMNGKPVVELDQDARIAALRASPLRLDVLTGDRAWVCTLTLE